MKGRMKRLWRWAIAVCACAAIAPTPAPANGSLEQMSQNPQQWVMPLGSYSGIRYSKLDQINVHNTKDLRVAWTMSTGTLRGQERLSGFPLKVAAPVFIC